MTDSIWHTVAAPSTRRSSTTSGWSFGAAASPSRCSRRYARSRTGYTLRKVLAEHGLVVDEGTLYPLLRRLETQGLLVSEWREEGKRNKRFYRLSVEGQHMLTLLLVEWRSLDTALDDILAETQHGTTGPIPASR